MARRVLSWGQALIDIRADRAVPPEIREERLHVHGLARPMALSLSSWRGRSGRRYVVTVHPIAEASTLAGACLVGLAVTRDAEGRAAIAEVRTRLALSRLDRAAQAGLTEFHVYRLAENGRQQHAAVMDLTA